MSWSMRGGRGRVGEGVCSLFLLVNGIYDVEIYPKKSLRQLLCGAVIKGTLVFSITLPLEVTDFCLRLFTSYRCVVLYRGLGSIGIGDATFVAAEP